MKRSLNQQILRGIATALLLLSGACFASALLPGCSRKPAVETVAITPCMACDTMKILGPARDTVRGAYCRQASFCTVVAR